VLVRRIAFIIRYGNAYFSDDVPDGITEGDAAALEAACELPPELIESDILPEFITAPCPPWSVLAITFTNKAAREIKERLSSALGDPAISDEIWAGTFHSICVRILRRYGELVGYRSGFSIYDTDDKRRLISDVMKRLGIDEKKLPIKAVANQISAAKDNLIAPADFRVNPQNPRDREIAQIYAAYQKALVDYNALDFDDIIMKTVEILENHEEPRSYYQNKFHYVCVDEYQDTNPAQFRLTELLAAKHRNIMVVGDDDQSIYRFRGATIENILSFDRVYADAKVIKLEQNYRSTKKILAAANAVISHNQDRHDKRLWCASKEGDPIVLRMCDEQNDEARYITETIMQSVIRDRRRYRDFAVLYRVNELSRSLEGGFAKSGIPYRVLGSQRFYDRKEIRDIVAYLYLIQNDGDDQRLRRVINEPKRKIGQATVDLLSSIALSEGRPMFAVMRDSADYPELAKASERLLGFVSLIESLRRAEAKPSVLIDLAFRQSGYRAMLEAEGEVSKTRIDSINEFISAAIEYEGRTESPTLSGFLEEVALISDVDKYDEDADAVVLMTIHSAKGLEFPIVFLAGMEEGIFPGMQTILNPGEMSEERRLAYVAITRAKERLYLTHTRERTMYGRTGSNPLSRFIREELPEELIEKDAPRPRFFTPTANYSDPRSYQPKRSASSGNLSGEISRRADIAGQAARSPRASSAEFGVARFADGTRVSHAVFGAGTVLSSREMGGDVLYEVSFDSGSVKRLMATYAKLKKL
jgi:DNA helicase-2/ATP-dependent DNA helicase PcrA